MFSLQILSNDLSDYQIHREISGYQTLRCAHQQVTECVRLLLRQKMMI